MRRRATAVESKSAFVEVASMVTTEFPIGVVVPKEDGVVLPETAEASREKAEEEILNSWPSMAEGKD